MVDHVGFFVCPGHHPAAINHEDDLLALVGLVVSYGELLTSRGRTPVDVFVVVVLGIVSQPFKFVVLTNAP